MKKLKLEKDFELKAGTLPRAGGHSFGPKTFRYICHFPGIESFKIVYIKSLQDQKLEIGVKSGTLDIIPKQDVNHITINILGEFGDVITSWDIIYDTYETLPIDLDYRKDSALIYRYILSGVKYNPSILTGENKK